MDKEITTKYINEICMELNVLPGNHFMPYALEGDLLLLIKEFKVDLTFDIALKTITAEIDDVSVTVNDGFLANAVCEAVITYHERGCNQWTKRKS